jgi:hypothetical protein
MQTIDTSRSRFLEKALYIKLHNLYRQIRSLCMIVYPSEMKASWAFKGLQKGGFTKILVIALHHNAEFDFLGKMRNVVDANV